MQRVLRRVEQSVTRPSWSTRFASTSAPSSEPSTSTPPSGSPTASRRPTHPSTAPTPTFSAHTPLPPTHGIHVASLHLRAYTSSLPRLAFFTQFALRSARAFGLPTSNAVALPTRSSLYTVPRSPFAHKKSQENFVRKEHKRLIKVWDANEDVVNAWLGYLRKEAMGGVGMKVQTIEYRELGWGQNMVNEEGLRLIEEQDKRGDHEVESLAAHLVKELQGEVQAAAPVAEPKEDKKVLEETASST